MNGSCLLCDGKHFEDEVVVYDRVMPRRDDYRLRRCRTCSLVSLAPFPDVSASLYPEGYAPHAREVRSEQTPSWLARRRLIQPYAGSRLLDVGCGSGRMLARHRAVGWDVRGIEPDEAAARICRERGFRVESVSLEDAQLPEAHFDLILLHHVIEHVRQPVSALRRVRRALAPGGQVLVVTPNVGGLGFRLYGSCWYALDAPRHLHLFDARTLGTLAERAGLRAVRIASEASARVLASSRHYRRSQGAVLPSGLAARAAVIARCRAAASGTAAFRRTVRPLARVASWLGAGETLRARLVVPGRQP
ncbi:MAG: class I SAM-dependent methyltransferase [Myxococcota bacterium]|nr:class I SAM-dependent methyltransferase [Myxococcota bacterium]